MSNPILQLFWRRGTRAGCRFRLDSRTAQNCGRGRAAPMDPRQMAEHRHSRRKRFSGLADWLRARMADAAIICPRMPCMRTGHRDGRQNYHLLLETHGATECRSHHRRSKQCDLRGLPCDALHQLHPGAQSARLRGDWRDCSVQHLEPLGYCISALSAQERHNLPILLHAAGQVLPRPRPLRYVVDGPCLVSPGSLKHFRRSQARSRRGRQTLPDCL